MDLACCYCKQVNSSCLSGSVWCLRGSEKTILVFEVSHLIKGEIIRASCSGWKSQTLHRALKGRAALRNSMLQRRKSHKNPSTVLAIASWKSWAASSMKRDRNQIQLPRMLLSRGSDAPFCGTLIAHQTATFLLLGRLVREKISKRCCLESTSAPRAVPSKKSRSSQSKFEHWWRSQFLKPCPSREVIGCKGTGRQFFSGMCPCQVVCVPLHGLHPHTH